MPVPNLKALQAVAERLDQLGLRYAFVGGAIVGRPMGSGRIHAQPEPKTVSFRRISVQQSKGTA